MRIAYFSNQFADPYGHGIARYARELYRELRLHSSLHVTPIAAWSGMSDEKLRSHIEQTGLKILPWGRRLTPLSWALLNNPKIESWLDDPIDLVHGVSLGYPIASNKPYVVTIHDLGPLTHPEHFTMKGTRIMTRSLKQAANHADALICVSQATADEVESVIGGQVGNRIKVIHEGIGAEFFEPAPNCQLEVVKRLKAQNIPFILSTGKISPRKNILALIRALAELADVIPHHLILVGGEGWNTAAVQEEFRNSPIADRIHSIGFVSDEELRSLYGAASAYAHPSLYEGFGLPLLEAMASDCPVITSNISSLPEVAGDAAVLIDPHSVADIAAGIEKVCIDDDFRAQLIEKGRHRAREFSWTACARSVLDVYQSIV